MLLSLGQRQEVITIAGHQNQLVFPRKIQNFRVGSFSGQRRAQPRHRMAFLLQHFRDAFGNVVIEEKFHAPASAIWLAIRWSISAR